MHKIQNQADIDHEQAVTKQKIKNEETGNSELQLIAGDIIQTKERETDMEGQLEYLQGLIGGPLT